MDHEVGKAGGDHADPNQKTATTEGSAPPALVHVRHLLAQGNRAPEAYAEILRTNPTAKAEILAELHGSLGNAAVLSIVQDSVSKPTVSELPVGKVRVTNAEHGLRVRSAPNQHADNVIGLLANHETVNATGNAGEFAAIDHGGAPGFVHASYVEVVTGTSRPDVAAPLAPLPITIKPPHAAEEAKPVVPKPVAQAPVVNPIADQTMHADTPVPTTLGPTPTLTPPPTTATPKAPAPAGKKLSTEYQGYALDDTSYLHEYTRVEGGAALDADAPTNEKTEAPILATLRNNRTRIDPVYLKSLQDALPIKDRSGAMNTETLRALVAYHAAHDKKPVTADSILHGDSMTSIVAGSPLRDAGVVGGSHGMGSTARVPHGVKKADGLARSAGYLDYADMVSKFVPIKLYGKFLGDGLPHLAARVKVASDYLEARYPPGTDPKKVAQEKLGWNYTGNAAYSNSVSEIALNGGKFGPHMHSAGLAIDIDPLHNSWVFTGGDVNPAMAKHLRYAAQLYGGEAVSAAQLDAWSKKMSTEELFARVDKVSKSLTSYLKLCQNGSDQEIVDLFKTNAGFTEKQARDVVITLRHFGKKDFKEGGWGGNRYWQDTMSRNNVNTHPDGSDEVDKLTTHSKEILVALRDVAGLSWGGSEMSPNENGDFMHFDCRNDPGGAEVSLFANHNQGFTDADNGA